MTKQCQNCVHWRPNDRATDYMAMCHLMGRRMQFDDYCTLHEAEKHPAPNQQSQVRGVWQQWYPGAK